MKKVLVINQIDLSPCIALYHINQDGKDIHVLYTIAVFEQRENLTWHSDNFYRSKIQLR